MHGRWPSIAARCAEEETNRVVVSCIHGKEKFRWSDLECCRCCRPRQCDLPSESAAADTRDVRGTQRSEQVSSPSCRPRSLPVREEVQVSCRGSDLCMSTPRSAAQDRLQREGVTVRGSHVRRRRTASVPRVHVGRVVDERLQEVTTHFHFKHSYTGILTATSYTYLHARVLTSHGRNVRRSPTVRSHNSGVCLVPQQPMQTLQNEILCI